MIDPGYTSDALAWLVLWVGGGLATRQWLAGRDQQARAATARAAREHELTR